MAQKIQIRRTVTPNSPPSALSPGELSIEMATPTRLWVGVPAAQDPTQKKLLVDLSAGAPGENAGIVLTVVNATSSAIFAVDSPARVTGAEGVQLLSVPIVVKSATSKLRIRGGANFYCPTAIYGFADLFTSLSPSPVGATGIYLSPGTALVNVNPGSGLIAHGQSAGSTVTCLMRGGRSGTQGILYVNGSAAATPWAGPTNIWLDVEEIAS